ncbi:response regulator [Massilia phyllosphaerae]|uniref:response regulator n=1 Tax=Massilia phyllosphaerae TaxID=3106034 RepID=UPI002B1CB33E|nr:response regulator [Massilia sp. SGZ-792]
MKKILLVDDMDVDRMLTRLALDRYYSNLRIVVACSCEEAYQSVQQQHFDLILLDITMPLLGGLELLERLYFEGIKIPPCIIISASSKQVDRALAMALGASDYIHKAVDYSVFKDELRAALDRQGLT